MSRKNLITFYRHLKIFLTVVAGSEFQRVGAATEKAIVPMFVSTLGAKKYLKTR